MRNSFQLTRTSSKFWALSIPSLTLLVASRLALLLQRLLDAIYDPHGKSVLILSIQLASTVWLNYRILLIYQWICHMDLCCLRKVTEVVKTIKNSLLLSTFIFYWVIYRIHHLTFITITLGAITIHGNHSTIRSIDQWCDWVVSIVANGNIMHEQHTNI